MNRGKQAQAVADMLLSMQTGPRTMAEMVGLTGLCDESVLGWLLALEAVGILRQDAPRLVPVVGRAGGRPSRTWVRA